MSVADIQKNNELQDLYRELILDHSRSPRNFGKLPTATHSAEGINPLCGDKLHLYLRVAENDIIDAVAFEGSGCAISVASTSLLTEMVVGKSRTEALALFQTATSHLTAEKTQAASDAELGKLRALEGVREFPARVKCATLPWHALHSAFKKQATPASTE